MRKTANLLGSQDDLMFCWNYVMRQQFADPSLGLRVRKIGLAYTENPQTSDVADAFLKSIHEMDCKLIQGAQRESVRQVRLVAVNALEALIISAKDRVNSAYETRLPCI